LDGAGRLASVFAGIQDPVLMAEFFTEIFTPAEIDDLVLRWRLLEMLHSGNSQREIATELGISLCKITRGSKVLRSGGSVTERILLNRIGDKDEDDAID
jgi:TrpR family trp operon transcriptional repressor